jgi:lipid-binding SYLF domain-containing protein
MKKQSGIGRRELFKKLAVSTGAMSLAASLPASARALADDPVGLASATVRVILSDGTSVQWMAVTSGGLTVGGKTSITAGAVGLNSNILKAAIAAIIAAGGPRLTSKQIVLFGGAV